MENIKIRLRDEVREFPCGVTAFEVAQSIGAGLAKAACAASIDGKTADLRSCVKRENSLFYLLLCRAD